MIHPNFGPYETYAIDYIAIKTYLKTATLMVGGSHRSISGSIKDRSFWWSKITVLACCGNQCETTHTSLMACYTLGSREFGCEGIAALCS